MEYTKTFSKQCNLNNKTKKENFTETHMATGIQQKIQYMYRYHVCDGIIT